MKRCAVMSGALVALAACGGADKTAETPDVEQPCDEMQACAAPTDDGDAPATDHDWSGFESWAKLTDEPFASEGHQGAWVEVYVTPDHVDAFQASDGEMPVGMGIVKAAHADDAGEPGELQNLTVMAKMEPGYDPEHGDWYYGVLSADGTEAIQQGKLEMCIGCHEDAETDYVFGDTGAAE